MLSKIRSLFYHTKSINKNDQLKLQQQPKVLSIEDAVRAAAQEERESILRGLSKMTQSTKHIALTEDPNNGLIPQLINSKLDIETDSHPFFKRVWIIRHRLDENSPLLSETAQLKIKENGGYWPAEYNNYKAVREHLGFNEMIVMLSGTYNSTGNTVYSQKVYDFVDVNVGWRFANTLAADPKTNALSVDVKIINDGRGCRTF
jgi:hypothetical protein